MLHCFIITGYCLVWGINGLRFIFFSRLHSSFLPGAPPLQCPPREATQAEPESAPAYLVGTT